jgi:hypothetical protein
MDMIEERHAIVSQILRDYALRRLPYALSLSEQTWAGEGLDTDEAEFLDAMLSDAENAASAFSDDAELRQLRDCVSGLHRAIHGQVSVSANVDDCAAVNKPGLSPASNAV